MNLKLLNGAYILVLFSLSCVSGFPATPLPKYASELYSLTNIWTIHLKFTAKEWEEMEPQGGPGGGFGPRGPGRGGDRMMNFPGGDGPGRDGARRGGGREMAPPDEEEFGPGMFVAPALMARGDKDKDGILSKEEFKALAGSLYSASDKAHTGKVNTEQLTKGLNELLAQGSPMRLGPGGPGFSLQGPEGKRNGLASALGIEFKYVQADLEFEGETFKDIGARYKGNGTFMESRGSLKRSLKLDINRNVKGQKLAGLKTLNLHNNVTDASWMNEVLSYRLYRDAKVPAPRTAYARVFVTVPGKMNHQYLGLYSVVENVDPDFAKERFGDGKGPLFKPVTPDIFTDLGDNWEEYKQTYDPKAEISPAQQKRLMDLCKLVSHSDDATFASKIGDYVDLTKFGRFMAVMVFLSDMDGILGPGQNFYAYLEPRTQKLVFIPWDQDHSFGQFPIRGTQEQRENLSIQKPWEGSKRFLERVYSQPGFQESYLAALKEFSQSIFKPDRLTRQVDELAAAIAPAVKEESPEKLVRFKQVVAGKIPEEGQFAMGPGPRFGPMKPIKPFVLIRAASIESQLKGETKGMEIAGMGMMRGPGRGRGQPQPEGDFGPGNFLAGSVMQALDSDRNGELSAEETNRGFEKWFEAWNTDQTGKMTEKQLKIGINRNLSPRPGDFPGGPGPNGPGGPAPNFQR